jgi:polysaccharide deacetylase family protein (PEP-CTERM system associated)
MRSPQLQSVLSVDVEDWFHILDVGGPELESWSELPSHVEKGFRRLLELLAAHDTQVTCFFLGWVAERRPDLVREAAAAGHEIASHGYAHRLVFEMTPAEFRADAERARCVLEDITATPVTGYRAASFSLTENTPWFYEELAAAGYRYDSSLFPATRGHGGIPGGRMDPHRVQLESGRPMIEFPISVATVLGRPFCFFGGGYLRLSPYWLLRRMGRRVLAEGRPLVFYVHPREMDPAAPRLSMPPYRRFKSYVNLRGTDRKIEKLLRDFHVGPFRDLLNHYEPCEGTVDAH